MAGNLGTISYEVGGLEIYVAVTWQKLCNDTQTQGTPHLTQ